MKIEQIEYHRNGSGGEPFYAVRFTDPGEGPMLAIVFPPDPDGDGGPVWELDHRRGLPRVAVLKEALLPDVTFGVNSWRGDRYAAGLYAALAEREKNLMDDGEIIGLPDGHRVLIPVGLPEEDKAEIRRLTAAERARQEQEDLKGSADMTTPPLTPAEHRERAESCLRQLQSHGPGSLAYHGLAMAAAAHYWATIDASLQLLAEWLKPPTEPDIPGLPLGWRITTRQSGNGARKWGFVLTRPGREPESSEYRYGSSPGALMAGLEYAPTLPDYPQDTEDDTTGEQ